MNKLVCKWCIALFLILNFYANAQTNLVDVAFLQSTMEHAPVPIDFKKNRVQIIVGNCVKSHHHPVQFYSFGLDSSKYFYPASGVKLPIVMLAMEWLNEHKSHKVFIDTDFELKSDYTCHSFKSNDNNVEEKLSIENCIKKILLVSDNNSYNALFDLMGREYIHRKLQEKGFFKTRIVKSFSGCPDSLLNFKPAVQFFNDKKMMVYQEPELLYNSTIERLPFDCVIGDSVMIDSITTLAGGKDFSKSNYMPLDEAMKMLVDLVHPGKNNCWRMTEKQRKFIMYWMSRYPRESKMNLYADTSKYFDAYKKYFVYGKEANLSADNAFRIYNVVGLAYGFATDIAYMQSNKSKKGIFIAATTYSNNDGVINDNRYDYETIGFPFLKYLGKSIYLKGVEGK
ncbi:MAG: serine hydrolase [Bacteroidota bacterium]